MLKKKNRKRTNYLTFLKIWNSHFILYKTIIQNPIVYSSCKTIRFVLSLKYIFHTVATSLIFYFHSIYTFIDSTCPCMIKKMVCYMFYLHFSSTTLITQRVFLCYVTSRRIYIFRDLNTSVTSMYDHI